MHLRELGVHLRPFAFYLFSETNICFGFVRGGVIFCEVITICRKRKQQNPPIWRAPPANDEPRHRGGSSENTSIFENLGA
jgi:hypothetical protein